MKVYIVERLDSYGYCTDYRMVVVAEDDKRAERAARWESDDFRRAKLKVSEVDTSVEAVISVQNTGA